LEIDRSTENIPRFLREKILPGLAYLKSEAYAERFGHRSERWLRTCADLQTERARCIADGEMGLEFLRWYQYLLRDVRERMIL
jgi:hypothetical protein